MTDAHKFRAWAEKQLERVHRGTVSLDFEDVIELRAIVKELDGSPDEPANQRDVFAAAALASIGSSHPKDRARYAYTIADAMIEARKA